MPFFYPLFSVFLVSLISLIGIFTLSLRQKTLENILLYLVSFSTGALFGDAFLHLLPEIARENGFNLLVSLSLLGGIVFFFIVEKFICWRHCHVPTSKEHPHPFAFMNLLGDGVHNFIDGLIIGASFLIGMPVGIATTIAVILHEIPQEIGDFGVLVYGGFSKKTALFLNFATSLTAFLGVFLGIFLGSLPQINLFLIPFAAGGFVYIAGSDLIPQLHKERKPLKSFFQLLSLTGGIFIMVLLLLID